MPVLVVERGRPVQEVAGDEEHLVVQWPVRVVHSPPGVRLRLLVVAQRIAHDTEVATAQPLTELSEKRRLIAIRHRVSSMIGSSGWQTDLPHVLQFQGSHRPAGPSCPGVSFVPPNPVPPQALRERERAVNPAQPCDR